MKTRPASKLSARWPSPGRIVAPSRRESTGRLCILCTQHSFETYGRPAHLWGRCPEQPGYPRKGGSIMEPSHAAFVRHRLATWVVLGLIATIVGCASTKVQ